MTNHDHDDSKHNHKHFILPVKMIIGIGLILFVFTVITVLISKVDMGAWNFPVAMLVATIKGALVVFFFMGMKYDTNENRVYFFTSFLFVAIFMILTATDIFYRGDVVVNMKDPIFKQVAGGPSKFKKPWVSSPELLANGKALYDSNCVACHGAKGMGDGPAAASLTPRPRNFSQPAGWLKGRKPSQVFDTLTNGVGKMPAFGSLPADDRWSLAQYVLSLGPATEADTVADLKKVGIDPNDPNAGSSGPKTIPIEFAIDRIAE